MKWIDTHTHYDGAAFAGDRDELFKKIADFGIEKVICPATTFSSNRTMLEILNNYPYAYFALGMHPKYILSEEQRNLFLRNTPKYKDLEQYLVNAQNVLSDIKYQITEISSLLHTERVIGVGETGLDYSYRLSSDEKALQSAVFRSFIEIALKQKLPIILHVRDAHEDALNILRSYNTRFSGVIHCFRDDKDLANQYTGLGFRLGIGTSIFRFPKLLEAIRYIDIDKIVLETDSPYLRVEGITDDRNTSLSIPLIAKAIANEKGIPIDQVAEATYENALETFNI